MDLQRTSKAATTHSGPRKKPGARLPYPWLLAAQVACVVIAVLALVRFTIAVPSYYTQLSDPTEAVRTGLAQLGISAGSYATFRVALAVLVVLAYYVVAGALFWRKSDNRVALFASLFLTTFGVNAAFLLSDLAGATPDEGWLFKIPEYTGWVCLSLFFYLFPDGRFTPRWTRALAALIAVLQVPLTFIPDSSLSREAGWDLMLQVLFLGIWGSGLFAQIYRYRHVSDRMQRQQTKWVVFGAAATVTGTAGVVLPGIVSPSLASAGSPYTLTVAAVGAVPLLFIPLTIGIAILRHHLWDIDLIISRTLVYGALTISVVGLYILVVGYLGAVFRTSGNLAISLIAAGLVAVLFQPLRERLQRSVNRLMYGKRDEPYVVLSRLGRRLEATLEPEAVLPTLVEDIARALRLPHVGIWFADGDKLLLGAAHGETRLEMSVRDPGATEGLRQTEEGLSMADLDSAGEYRSILEARGVTLILPLFHRGELVGTLSLAPRGRGEGFSSADRRLLRDLATQSGAAVHAVRLTAALRSSLEDLRRSREKLVAAQEEERRRIQRDLHDGLGPVLASMRLRLEACLDETETPLSGDLERLYELVGQATGDIRRLVYDLRPPVLDQLGLVPAIRQHCDRFGRESGIECDFDAEPELLVPAAAEVTILRVVQEALLNVQRHARASRVDVLLERYGRWLGLKIRDDGVGFGTDGHDGTGIVSMRERAELLGGTLQLSCDPGSGTQVALRIPVEEAKR